MNDLYRMLTSDVVECLLHSFPLRVAKLLLDKGAKVEYKYSSGSIQGRTASVPSVAVGPALIKVCDYHSLMPAIMGSWSACNSMMVRGGASLLTQASSFRFHC